MLAPAAVVTALVVVLGFAVDPGDDDTARRTDARTSGSATPSGPADASPTPSAPSAQPASGPQARLKPGMLTGPRVVLKPKPKPKPQFRTVGAASFTVASFNVLGHSHTVPGGNRPGYASSRTRMGLALDALYGRGVEVVGLQEFQAAQFHNLMGRAGGTWDVWPGMAVGHNGVENSIAWRQDTFTAVEKHVIDIPYFGGRTKAMPYVLLRHDATGQEFWFANFHNPADTSGHGRNGKHRRAATAREIDLANRLAAPNRAVFFTGDFNERAEYFCRLTGNTALKAANGGSTGSSCSPPDRMLVDWVFGSDHVDFTSYSVIDGRTVDRASDHPLVAADVTVPAYRVQVPAADPD